MENSKFLCKNKFHVEFMNQLTQVNQYELVKLEKCSQYHCLFLLYVHIQTDSKDKN